ncbi:hypothetical protein MCEME17_00372 [Candidatus Pelagibacterales bacterium]
MFESWYLPSGWKSEDHASLDQKDFEKVKDLQNNLLGSKFIQSNNISITINHKEFLEIDNRKDLKFEFRAMKFSKLFDKLYVPYIQMFKSEQESKQKESYIFVDDLSQAHYINSYPSHLHSNLIQFTKFMLGKKSTKLSDNEIKELYSLSGFKSDQ